MNKKNKITIIILFALIILFITVKILILWLSVGDEFINFYNTYKIYMGEKIYKEVNVVSTPLLFYIGVLFLKIFGPNLITFKFYAIVMNSIIVITTYKIFRNLKIKQEQSMLYTIIIEIILSIRTISMGATYNLMAYMFCLIGINNTIKKKETKNYYKKQGIIIFLIFMSKQNIGIYYTLANIVIEIIENRKNWIKTTIKMIILPISLFGIYLLYLYIDNNLYNFIDLTVLGLREFKNNYYIDMGGLIAIYANVIFISLIIGIPNRIQLENVSKEITTELLVIGIFLIMVGYPIVDCWHLSFSVAILAIDVIYILQGTLLINEKIYNIILLILTILIALFCIFECWSYLCVCCKDKNDSFYLMCVQEKRNNKINKISKYIYNSDKKVVIMSPEAELVYFRMKIKSNGILDLPLQGNLGKNGKEKIINQISNYNDIYFLMTKEKFSYQEMEEVRKFVIDNYNQIGEIENYNIYYIK